MQALFFFSSWKRFISTYLYGKESHWFHTGRDAIKNAIIILFGGFQFCVYVYCIWIHMDKFQINIYFKRQTMKFCICFRMVRGILLLSMFCSSQAVLKFNNYFGIYSFTSCEFSYRRNQRLSYKNMTRDSYTLYIHIQQCV